MQAYTCQNTGQASYSTPSGCSSDANKAGTTVIGAATANAAVSQTVGLISARVSQFTSAANAPGGRVVAAANGGPLVALGTGTAAGGSDNKIGVWANGSWTRVIGNKNAVNFDGSIWTGMVGADYMFTKGFVGGLALGYENAEYDTAFNNGNTDSSGYTVAPYIIARINDTFSVDFNVGYTRVDYDLDRLDPLDASKITGDADSNRWFGALNLNGDWLIDSFTLGANIGTLYAREDRDGFTESNSDVTLSENIDVGRINLGGRVGYLFEDVVEPYISALAEYDYANEKSAYDDRVGVVLGAGVNVFAGEGFSANLEGTTTQARSGLDIWSVNATVRYEF